MKRVGALVGAIAMIALAVVIRDAIDGDGGGSGGGGGGPVQLACVTEVEDACRQLAEDDDDVEVTVVDAGETAAALTDPAFRAAQGGIDAWVTVQPWPELVNTRAERSVLGDPEALASSRLVLVAEDQRAEALLASCGLSSTPESEDLVVGWRCVGDIAGQPWADNSGEPTWGDVKPGHADAAATASGLVVIGQLGAAYFDGPDFASNDFDSAFRSWFQGLESEVPDFSPNGSTPLAALVQRGPSAYGVVGTTEAEATSAIDGTRAEDTLTVLYPAPMATALVVLAPVTGAPGADDAADLADDLTDDLAATGWDTDDPAQSGLPSAGVMDALQRLWEQIT